MPVASPLTLLPHTTSTAPARPLPVHETNVLSDICHSLKEVAELTSTDRGREHLAEYLNEVNARDLGEFWEGEWIVE